MATELWAYVDAQRARTVALLGPLSSDQWTAPSLCGDWTIKEVAGHLAWHRRAAHWRYLPQTLRAVARTRGDVYRAIGDEAVRYADARTTDDLLREVEELVGWRGRVIGSTDHEMLIDVLVHHQDMALALGRDLDMETGAALLALERTSRLPRGFTLPVTRTLVNTCCFVATDVEWSTGVGPQVRGSAAAILLILMGRAPAIRHLDGDGVDLVSEVVGVGPAVGD